MTLQTYGEKFARSPSFNWTNAELTGGSEISVDWFSYASTSQKYLPFNNTRIINNGEADIWFYPNNDRNSGIFVPRGVITTLDRTTLPAVRGFTILNAEASTTITAGKLIITNSNQGQTTDSIVERFHENVFKRFFGRGDLIQ